LVISNRHRFRVLFDKIASVYFIGKIYSYFSIGNGLPGKRHCANCIGALSFPIYKTIVFRAISWQHSSWWLCNTLIGQTAASLTHGFVASISKWNAPIFNQRSLRGNVMLWCWPCWLATTCYNILQHRERIDMFIIARQHITPRRMLYRARIVVESYSNRARIAIVIGPLVSIYHREWCSEYNGQQQQQQQQFAFSPVVEVK